MTKENKGYDPSYIRIITMPIDINTIFERFRDYKIIFNSEFQAVWDDVTQSRLIESILIRMPIQSLYFEESDGGVWQVIDGGKRISAIKNFVVDKTLKLVGLEYLTELDGKMYSELSPPLKRRIGSFSIESFLIEKGTPLKIKQNLIKRIKTGCIGGKK